MSISFKYADTYSDEILAKSLDGTDRAVTDFPRVPLDLLQELERRFSQAKSSGESKLIKLMREQYTLQNPYQEHEPRKLNSLL